MRLPNAEGPAGLWETVSPAGFLQPRPHQKGTGIGGDGDEVQRKPIRDWMSFPSSHRSHGNGVDILGGHSSACTPAFRWCPIVCLTAPALDQSKQVLVPV